MKSLLQTSALALVMLSSVSAAPVWTVELTFPGFEFGCQGADGRKLEPPYGDIEDTLFALSPGRRGQHHACLDELDRLEGDCFRRGSFDAMVGEAPHPECGEVFRQQIMVCAWRYTVDEHKCRVGQEAVWRDRPAQRAWVQSRNFAGTHESDDAAPGALSASGWMVTVDQSCKLWNPDREEQDVVSWTGDCDDGTASGTGRLVWHDGGRMHSFLAGVYLIYEGEMHSGRAHGQGTATWNNAHKANSRYEGQWREGRPHGHGTYISPDGGVFEGQWSRGCFRGFGDRWVAIGATARSCTRPARVPPLPFLVPMPLLGAPSG